MDPFLAWFASAPSTDACDFIGKGIADFRRVNKLEAEQRQRTRQTAERAFAAGKLSAADKAGFETADAQFEQRNKGNEAYDDALVVLAVLGTRLVGLNVVNQTAIDGAYVATQQAFQSI